MRNAIALSARYHIIRLMEIGKKDLLIMVTRAPNRIMNERNPLAIYYRIALDYNADN